MLDWKVRKKKRKIIKPEEFSMLSTFSIVFKIDVCSLLIIWISPFFKPQYKFSPLLSQQTFFLNWNFEKKKNWIKKKRNFKPEETFETISSCLIEVEARSMIATFPSLLSMAAVKFFGLVLIWMIFPSWKTCFIKNGLPLKKKKNIL